MHAWERDSSEHTTSPWTSSHVWSALVWTSGTVAILRQELEALTGWSAAMCLLLEVNDVAAPLLRSLFARVSTALQWLLTALIGRGLGLIFRGVRQSFRRQPSGRNADGSAQASPGFA